MAHGFAEFLGKQTPEFAKKILPKEIAQFSPSKKRDRRAELRSSGQGDGLGNAPTKVGLTDEARQTQGLTNRSRKLRQFETVFAGETGTIQTSKLGLTGRI